MVSVEHMLTLSVEAHDMVCAVVVKALAPWP